MNPQDVKPQAVETPPQPSPASLKVLSGVHKTSLKTSVEGVVSKISGLSHHLPLTRLVPTEQYTKVVVFISSMSVRYKIAGALIMVLALAIASLGGVTFSRQKMILEKEMKKRSEVLVQQLANVGKEGLLTKEELSVFSTIKDLQQKSGVVYAMVLDGDGRVFVHNRLAEKGKTMAEGPMLAAIRADTLLFQKTLHEGEPILEASLPIVSKVKNLKIGTAVVGISEKELAESIHKQKMIFIWISLLFVGIGLLISFGLAKVLTRPIYSLAVAMQVVAQGDLSQQVKVFYKDEIGRLTESFNTMILSLREKLHMEKYLSYSTLKSIKKNLNTTELKLGGERKYVTALFSDVRGFTAMSEKMSPEEVVSLLNIYLNLQSIIVHQRGGVVDKFVGDEVMAIFEGRGQELNAVRAAYEIQRYFQALNWARARTGKKQMQVGVGLNSGDVVMGNMGSKDQMNYTVIGDNINLAARLCSAAQSGQVVISKAVADAVSKDAKLKKLDPILVKGKDKPVDIYEVADVQGASRKYMRRQIALNVSYRLSGLGDEVNAAVARNMAPAGCLLDVTVPIGVGSRLELEFYLESLKYAVKTEAVVRHARKQDGRYWVGVHFENIPEKDVFQIVEWVHQVETEIVSGEPV